ncbi:CocE/NonD family hydrolase [Streptomyces sp. 1331.2]|uniref:CocE/NonD family hydrolase n=1 Tax=Streptomyces sp. 1331.2 TaxID=1938835 RepID=UPI000BDA4716|nr:CocE/NonD family hydrolase [Streptomyces sp. 1331.2]SOB81117.1 Predicted acyl esterase [Streptomyces sp. 1331.2]
MTTSGGEPIPSITDATLDDIATNGIWAGAGLNPSPAVIAVARALLAALEGAEGIALPPELAETVADVRRRAVAGVSRIEASGGVQLSAFSIRLSGSEPRPVVIVPAGWNPYGWLPFMYSYLSLALRGYHVLAYTPRGLGLPGWVSTSEGFVDVAGPKDRADGSVVIDHAQEHFSPSRIGFLGESYGSGISQLVAAHDRYDEPRGRVDAVVALSTWGNLATALYDNGTRHLAAVQALIEFTGGPLEEKFDPETQRILRNFLSGEGLDEVVAWGAERSPESYLDRTNARGIPTFVSNTWHESLFPAGQTIDTFVRLTVPKHLNMWIGDHGAPEGPGLAGLVGGVPFPGLREPMREAYEWLDHHLLRAGSEVPDWPQVNNQIMFTYRTEPVIGGGRRITVPARREPYPTWSGEPADIETWYPTGTGGTGDGALAEKPASGWTRDFTAGDLTSATAMDAVMATGQKEWFGSPKAYAVGGFERERLLVWSTDPLSGPEGVARRIRGAATVRLTVRNTAGAATLVAYLFDVAPDGTARIITHEPFTDPDLPAATDRTVSWKLQPAAYDLPEGHRLALVVNSRDKLYAFTGSEGSTTAVSSPTGSEARLELPLG